MKTVICIKWGKKYGPEYVNRLHGMLTRHLSQPFELHCFTDDSQGISSKVCCHSLPELGCEHPTNVPGKWSKVALWGASLHGLKGKALFIDLDTVIVDSIDDFFEYGDEHDVILARNWLKPFKRLGQTTLFRYYIGDHPYILEEFRVNPQELANRYRYEQHYITGNIKGGIKFWPDTWVKHYRHHCLGGYIRRYFKPAKIPKGAKIIAFPGEPNPADALVGRWTGSSPVSPRQHLKNMFDPQKRVRSSWVGHLRCFQLPCPWVKKHWREE